MTEQPKDLVQIIRDNPGCIAVIDNDCWSLFKEEIPECVNEGSEEAFDGWMKSNHLADSDDAFVPLGDGGYGSGNCYGGDILQALATIVGITVRSE